MESLEAYLERKHQELELLASCLREPAAIERPASVVEVIKKKFRIAAALKAEHALHGWAHTETDWVHRGCRQVGPFEFSYDYQRADLDVHGPSFYERSVRDQIETVYTSSGMAAISALLLASAHVTETADIVALPGTYGETIEVIQAYARHFHLIELEGSLRELAGNACRRRVLLLDSSIGATAFEETLNSEEPDFAFVIFDTTCFACGSGHIKRVANWARRWQLPIVLVRSHNKLDSLGIEYGRLGSAVFIDAAGQPVLREFAAEMRNAVRLLGNAALPAHFPPYVGGEAHQRLTQKRIAAIVKNSRRMSRTLAKLRDCSRGTLHYAHGLYVTLGAKQRLNEQEAKETAANLASDLTNAGLPLRHAGSFGFDFAATEWFHDMSTDRHLVRIAMADLPTASADDVINAVAEWWSSRDK
jgi:hypothetical protein